MPKTYITVTQINADGMSRTTSTKITALSVGDITKHYEKAALHPCMKTT
jgi:hypothetical protein